MFGKEEMKMRKRQVKLQIKVIILSDTGGRVTSMTVCIFHKRTVKKWMPFVSLLDLSGRSGMAAKPKGIPPKGKASKV